MSENEHLGSPHGGGPQGEPIEGSLTDGGSLPGAPRADRSFGAGRRDEGEAAENPATQAAPAEPEPQIFEGTGEDPGATDAPPGEERSGYGNTPPR